MRLGAILMWKRLHYLTQTLRVTPRNCSFKIRDGTQGHDNWKKWDDRTKNQQEIQQLRTINGRNKKIHRFLHQYPHLSKLTYLIVTADSPSPNLQEKILIKIQIIYQQQITAGTNRHISHSPDVRRSKTQSIAKRRIKQTEAPCRDGESCQCGY